MNAKAFKKKAEEKLHKPDKQLELIPKPTDHDYYDIIFQGKLVRQLKVSRGSHEWGDGILNLVAGNLGISKSQVQGIVSCSFGTDDFLQKSRILPHR